MSREEKYNIAFDNGIEVEAKTYMPETIIGINVDKNSFEKLKKVAKEELGVDLIKDENKESYSFEELFPFKPLVPAEPDCSKCKHYRFGEDGRDITCHDCKWNYNDMFEEVTE